MDYNLWTLTFYSRIVHDYAGIDYIEQAVQLATEHHVAGRIVEAESIYRQILNAEPHNVKALCNLGVIALQTGHLNDAENLISQSVRICPSFSGGHNNLGNVYLKLESYEFAQDCFQRATSLEPLFADAHYNLGMSLAKLQQYRPATDAYLRAIELQPGFVKALFGLATTYWSLKDHQLAAKYYLEGLRIDPKNLEANNNAGLILKDFGDYDEAQKCFLRALEINPHHPAVLENYALLLSEQGQTESAIDCMRKSLSIRFYPSSQSNYLLMLHYRPHFSTQTIFEEHRQAAQKISQAAIESSKLASQGFHPNDRDPDRQLRIGYVSPDFRDHSVSHFILPLFESHNRNNVQVICYYNNNIDDEFTKRIQSSVQSWRNIAGMTDDAVAELVRQDQIDIFVDLAGHTARNRLTLFARKLAPIQVTYLGYPNTTGLETVDYWITDRWNDPIGQTEAFCSEKLIRLPHAHACYKSAYAMPDVVIDPPALKNGYVTFASFNVLNKIGGEVASLWAEILHEVPGSKLLVQAKGMGSRGTQDSFRERFAKYDIPAERLELLGPQLPVEHFQTVTSRADICLDTFPFTGHTVSLHTLWMGVPLVTLAGQSHVSRRGVSIMNNLGMPEFIATDRKQYIEIAKKLASDVKQLKQFRQTIRERMLSSPLMDAKQYAHDLEAAYRSMWQTWCMPQA